MSLTQPQLQRVRDSLQAAQTKRRKLAATRSASIAQAQATGIVSADALAVFLAFPPAVGSPAGRECSCRVWPIARKTCRWAGLGLGVCHSPAVKDVPSYRLL